MTGSPGNRSAASQSASAERAVRAHDVDPAGAPPSRISRRRLLRAALIGSSALGVAACTMPLPVPATPAASISPAAVTSEVDVGLVLSLTGRYSREGALMRAGFETWRSAVDQAGGIKVGVGRRAVRLQILDDESEPLNAGHQAERLASGGGVRLFLGPFSPAITAAVATVTSRIGAVLVAPDASAPDLYRRGFQRVFSVLPTDDRLMHGLADLASLAQPRAQPVGIIIADEPVNAAAAAGFRERAAALDLAPVQLELTALGSRDILPPLQRVAETVPRFIILATEAGQTARHATMLRELLPFTAMRALLPLPEPELSPTGGKRLKLYEGVLTVEHWSQSIAATGPVLGSATEFAEEFTRLHGYAPDARSAAAAAAGLALQLAVETAESTDPVAVVEALATLDLTTFWGRLAWDMAGRNRVAVPPVLQQQGERIVAVYPPALAGGTLQYPLAGWPRE